MLVQFRVRNFRSFRDEQFISMVAGPSIRRSKERTTFRSSVKGIPDILPVAGVIGPNAAGKSNLFLAIQAMRSVVTESKRRNPGDKVPTNPYLLNKTGKENPTEFEVCFIKNNNKYEYGIKITPTRILEEYLQIRELQPGKRNKTLFEREWENATNEYSWYLNPALRGQKEAWIESTHETASFLSTAVQLNADQLIEPYAWIEDGMQMAKTSSGLTHMSGDTDTELANNMKSFVNLFDIDVSEIKFSHKSYMEDMENVPTDNKEVKNVIESIRALMNNYVKNDKYFKISLTHESEDGEEIEFDMEDESAGTRSLINLSIPIHRALETGTCLLIDELNNTLHPYALRLLIHLFQNRKINKNMAQLIFSTHDTSVLSERLLERDQIWFVQKPDGKSSTIVPLSDFHPRRREALQRRYLSGRYGGVPVMLPSNLDAYSENIASYEALN